MCHILPLFWMLKKWYQLNWNNFRFAKKALHAANAGFAGLIILDDQVDTRISNIASASKNWEFLNLNKGFLPCQDFSTNVMFVFEKVKLPREGGVPFINWFSRCHITWNREFKTSSTIFHNCSTYIPRWLESAMLRILVMTMVSQHRHRFQKSVLRHKDFVTPSSFRFSISWRVDSELRSLLDEALNCLKITFMPIHSCQFWTPPHYLGL